MVTQLEQCVFGVSNAQYRAYLHSQSVCGTAKMAKKNYAALN